MSETFKKLVFVFAISISIIKASRKSKMVPKKILYIYYLLYFGKDKKNKVRTLINSGKKVNAITPVYALKLGLKI